MGRNRRWWVMAAFVLPVALLSSCGSGADDPVVGDGRTAAVYESVIHWLLDEEPGISAVQDSEFGLFVGSRSEVDVDLDVQVAVVEALEPRISVRFIDERSEAVDLDSENESVRDEGLLIGLGAVPEEGETVEVYVDRYRDSEDIEAWLVTIRRVGLTWNIVGSPASTDVRPLPVED